MMRPGQSPVVPHLQREYANAVHLHLEYAGYRWNVSGPSAPERRALFRDHAQSVQSTLEPLAERLRILGAEVAYTLEELRRLSSFPEERGAPGSAPEMILRVLSAHRIIIGGMQEAYRTAEIHTDPGSADVFARCIQVHERMEGGCGNGSTSAPSPRRRRSSPRSLRSTGNANDPSRGGHRPVAFRIRPSREWRSVRFSRVPPVDRSSSPLTGYLVEPAMATRRDVSDEGVHVEIPADDTDRARRFCSSTFGWKLNPMPEFECTMISTGPAEAQGMPIAPGYMGGGMGKRAGPLAHPVVRILVDEISAAEQSIERNGGKILQRKQPIGVGSMGCTGYFSDPERNVIGLFQRGKT
jgi:predicted enzyme related to lactoylglutathione lyase/DNA-binding ferritin-like protein